MLLISLFTVLVLFLSSCEGTFSFTYTGDYCADGLQDRDEEDVDCGGQYCDSCDATDTSASSTDSSSSASSSDSTSSSYDSTTVDTDSDGVVDMYDICHDQDDSVDVDGDKIPDCIDDIVVDTIYLVDTDGDGYTDGEEIDSGTNPADANEYPGSAEISKDTDGDGLSDVDEETIYGTDPSLSDTDGDGYPDLLEVTNPEGATDPLDPNDYPTPIMEGEETATDAADDGIALHIANGDTEIVIGTDGANYHLDIDDINSDVSCLFLIYTVGSDEYEMLISVGETATYQSLTITLMAANEDGCNILVQT